MTSKGLKTINYKYMKKLIEKIKAKFSRKPLLVIPDVSSSAWERKLVGKNIHSVFTWCKDCGMNGCNMPLEDECGNCGSKNTVRYYDKETIDILF
jgi:hypothetical protein